jgi:hypothetical protein
MDASEGTKALQWKIPPTLYIGVHGTSSQSTPTRLTTVYLLQVKTSLSSDQYAQRVNLLLKTLACLFLLKIPL